MGVFNQKQKLKSQDYKYLMKNLFFELLDFYSQLDSDSDSDSDSDLDLVQNLVIFEIYYSSFFSQLKPKT